MSKYHTLYFQHRNRIPWLPVAVMAVVVTIASYITYLNTVPQGTTIEKNEVRVERLDTVNLRDTSVTVFWRTKEPTEGYVLFGKGNDSLTERQYSDMDVYGAPQKRRNHIVTIRGLQPKSMLYFRVSVDNALVGQSPDLAYTVQTSRPLTHTPDIPAVYGDVVMADGLPVKNAVVLLTIGASSPLLTQTNKDGTFLFSLCCMIHAASGEPLAPASQDEAHITIISDDGHEKRESATFADMTPLAEPIVLDSTIPQLAQAEDGLSGNSRGSSGSGVLGTDTRIVEIGHDIPNDVDIIFPVDGAAIPGTQPLVRGVGEPGTKVKGIFASVGRIFQVPVDEERNWKYLPSFSFPPGEHVLTLEAVNAKGETIKLSRAFTILKSGESVLGDATSSATITPTSTPSATVEPTQAPTSTPSATVATTATPPPPVPGFNVLPLTILSLVLVVIGAAVILLF